MTIPCVAPVLTQADTSVIVHGIAAAGLQHLQVTSDAVTHLIKCLFGGQKAQQLGHQHVHALKVD